MFFSFQASCAAQHRLDRSRTPSVVETVGEAVASSVINLAACRCGADGTVGNAVLGTLLVLTLGWAVAATARPEWFGPLRERLPRWFGAAVHAATSRWIRQGGVERQQTPVSSGSSTDVETGLRFGGGGDRSRPSRRKPAFWTRRNQRQDKIEDLQVEPTVGGDALSSDSLINLKSSISLSKPEESNDSSNTTTNTTTTTCGPTTSTPSRPAGVDDIEVDVSVYEDDTGLGRGSTSTSEATRTPDPYRDPSEQEIFFGYVVIGWLLLFV